MNKENSGKKEDKMSKKEQELQQTIDELTADLQRVRADFENYRKRIEAEKEQARESGKSGAVLKILPVIDNIERAITHLPKDLEGNQWAEGVVSLVKNLEKSLQTLKLERITATPGTPFDPELHEAVQFDEEADGDIEVIAEELQAGYKLGGDVIRPSMVRVTRMATEDAEKAEAIVKEEFEQTKKEEPRELDKGE